MPLNGWKFYMIRVLFVIGLGVALSGCSSWMPSWVPTDISFGSPRVQTEDLRIESEPAGADARTSTGVNCRTPCVLTVPASNDFTVTVSAPGFQPQTVPVALQQARSAGDRELVSAAVKLDPNPVVVALEPAPPPAPVKKKPVAKKKPRPAKPA